MREIVPPTRLLGTCSVVFLLLGTSALHAASAESDPAGFITFTCQPGTDTFVSVPFSQTAIFRNTLGALPSVNGDQATLSFTNPPAAQWTANALVGTHYVRFVSGAKEGFYYEISANDGTTVTIDLNGDTLTGTAIQDAIKIVPHWTLDTLFPPDSQTTIVASSNNLGLNRRTEVFFPDLAGSGINRAAATRCFLNATSGWVTSSSGFPPAGDRVIPPDSYFVIRHPAAVSQATVFRPMQNVETTKLATHFSTLISGPQDNFITTGRPIDLSLSELGLDDNAVFVPSSNNLGLNRRDELFIYKNETTGINRAASNRYIRVGTEWREVTNNYAAVDPQEKVIPEGAAIVIRKYKSSDGSSVAWVNSPTY